MFLKLFFSGNSIGALADFVKEVNGVTAMFAEDDWQHMEAPAFERISSLFACGSFESKIRMNDPLQRWQNARFP